jgi:hypothetical protein
MRWTGWASLAACLLGLSGCVYAYRTVFVEARFSRASRPHASYFCYDCHGYRFFDPYYDWCVPYGFRYGWPAHPQVIALYRERYVRIRERHPEYGRYRYRPGYKSSPRYREGRDYEAWRSGSRGQKDRPSQVERKGRRSGEGKPRGESREREDRKKGDGKERRSERGGR